MIRWIRRMLGKRESLYVLECPNTSLFNIDENRLKDVAALHKQDIADRRMILRRMTEDEIKQHAR
jgi:hypothetical protein